MCRAFDRREACEQWQQALGSQQADVQGRAQQAVPNCSRLPDSFDVITVEYGQAALMSSSVSMLTYYVPVPAVCKLHSHHV